MKVVWRGRFGTLAGAIGGLLFVAAASPVQGEQFLRGDANTDGRVNLSDPIFTLNRLFGGGPSSSCADAQDSNDDGRLDIADPLFTLNVRYLGRGQIPPPSPGCGHDPTRDELDCVSAYCLDGPPRDVPDQVVTLASARVGLPYRGELPKFLHGDPAAELADYCVEAPGVLPAGLQLDSATGTVSGMPSAPEAGSYIISAMSEVGVTVRFAVRLDIFSAQETEIVPAPALDEPGPHAVGVVDSTFVFTHVFPWPPPEAVMECLLAHPPAEPEVDDTKRVRVYYPRGITSPAPVLFLHHGFGFEYVQYDTTLRHFASYGVVAVTVEDRYSFREWAFNYCGLGQVEGARVLTATRDHVTDLAADSESPLAGLVDISRTFYAGHSRGGAVALLAAASDPRTCGIVLLQPTDPIEDPWLSDSGRLVSLPGVPLLIVSAEQDRDTRFPVPERLFERVSGAATMVTIYGGEHGFTADDGQAAVNCGACDYVQEPGSVDRCGYISPEFQRGWIRRFGTAFLRRHGFGDLSVEGFIYGDESQRSPFVAVASHRNLGGALLVDDFRGFPTNSLGLSTDWDADVGGELGVGSCYDLPEPDAPSPLPAIENLVFTLPMSGEFAYRSRLGDPELPLNVALYRRLLFRIKNADRHRQVDNAGFDWLDASVTIEDTAGGAATRSLHDYLPAMQFHPNPCPEEFEALLKYQRYITVAIPLVDFVRAGASLRLDALQQLELRFVTHGASAVTPRLGLDDIRFE